MTFYWPPLAPVSLIPAPQPHEVMTTGKHRDYVIMSRWGLLIRSGRRLMAQQIKIHFSFMSMCNETHELPLVN